MKNTLEATIGNTPLAQIKRLNDKKGGDIYLKLEGNNPAGSVKDRPAFFMINEAELSGKIKPGDTLIEATSGNTGIALAMVAAMRGYKMVLIIVCQFYLFRPLCFHATTVQRLFYPVHL